MFADKYSLEHTLCFKSLYGSVHRVSPKATIFVPYEDVLYTPVLFHVALNEASHAALMMAKFLIEDETPPFVLFTSTNEHDTTSELTTFLEEQDCEDAFNVIFSIANKDIPEGFYTSLHNNLPLDLEEFLDAAFAWGLTSEHDASHAAELLSLYFNKPCVSFNVDTEDTADTLYSLARYVPRYEDWQYAQHTHVDLDSSGRCCLCNKKRGPQKFFYKIQGNLCPVCEEKIKKLGRGVDIISFAVAKKALDEERMRTRRANIRKNILGWLASCPKCGAKLAEGREGEHICDKCRSKFFKQDGFWIEATPERMLYSYTSKKLLRITSAYDQQYIQYCSSCGAPTTKGHHYERKDGTSVVLCDACHWNLQRTIENNSKETKEVYQC